MARTNKSKLILRPRLAAVAVVALSATFLAGCAGQMAYRDGTHLIAENKVEQGLAKLHEATILDPQDAQYRLTYLRAKEKFVTATLEQADRLNAAGQTEAAKQNYQRVLQNDAYNDRALGGLRKLDMDARHAQQMTEASAALEKKDVDTAKQKISAILAEDPNYAAAVQLQKSILQQHTAPSAEAQLASKYHKTINIEFRDVALRQVFDVIARTSGLNFLFDKDVKTDQKTSIFLKNSSIEAAVHYVLLTNQLEQQILDGNTILIYPNTAAKQKDYQEMVVRSFFLTNADAKSVANTLKTITKTRDIVIDEKLNMLIVRDSPEAIKVAEKLVALQDVPEPEVMLEVEILEVKRTRLQQLGMQWPASLGLTPLPSAATTTVGTGTGSTGTTTTTTTGTSNGLTLRDLSHLNRGTIGASIGSATLNANVQDGDANLLANPRIRARNHEKAKVLIGERVPNITTTATATGFVSESINYIDIGLTLNVEPTIYLDNDVAIKVSLEVSNIVSQIKTQSGSTAYEIGTRNANTVLRLKDGETQVLAGLIDDEFRRSGNRVPGVGEIPILGRLFGNQTDDDQKTEIVLSITPHLVRNIQRPDISQAEFRTGTDSSMRVRPDSVGAPAPVGATPNPTGTNMVPNNPNVPSAAPNSTPNNTPNGMTPTGSGLNGSSGQPISSGVSGTGQPTVIGDTGVGGGLVPAPGVQLSFQGANQVKVGSVVNVGFLLQANQSIANAALTLGFDNKVLQVVGITEGDFMKQAGGQSSFTSSVLSTGQIQMNDTRSGSAVPAGQGQLAVISFLGLAPSPGTPIQLLNGSTTGGINAPPIPISAPSPFILQVQ